MKPLSETYKELGIAFTFPIEITDANGDETYFERSNGYWERWERDADGDETYYEDSDGEWVRWEYDANGNLTYFENSNGDWARFEYDAEGKRTYYETSDGYKNSTPRSTKTCEGKVVEVDGIKYKLTAL